MSTSKRVCITSQSKSWKKFFWSAWICLAQRTFKTVVAKSDAIVDAAPRHPSGPKKWSQTDLLHLLLSLLEVGCRAAKPNIHAAIFALSVSSMASDTKIYWRDCTHPFHSICGHSHDTCHQRHQVLQGGTTFHFQKSVSHLPSQPGVVVGLEINELQRFLVTGVSLSAISGRPPPEGVHSPKKKQK